MIASARAQAHFSTRLMGLQPTESELREMVLYLAGFAMEAFPYAGERAIAYVEASRAPQQRFVAGPEATTDPTRWARWSVIDTMDGRTVWVGSVDPSDPDAVLGVRTMAETMASKMNRESSTI